MREILKRLIIAIAKPLFKLIGERRTERFLVIVADLAEVELITPAYEQAGIIRYSEDFRLTGESQVIDSILPRNLKSARPVLFDVGANRGGYTKMLCEAFSGAEVYAFEPNKEVFGELRESAPPSARCFNLGLGEQCGDGTIYTYRPENARNNPEHASVYQAVFPEYHRSGEVVGAPFEMDTLDSFCAREMIDRIDFLKIDTEGHELAVLRGGAGMLAGNRIGIIQFEFNILNVYSRVFLRDFYDLLKAYHIYRLHPKGPIPVFDYNPKYEVFVYQNYLAVHRGLSPGVG